MIIVMNQHKQLEPDRIDTIIESVSPFVKAGLVYTELRVFVKTTLAMELAFIESGHRGVEHYIDNLTSIQRAVLTKIGHLAKESGHLMPNELLAFQKLGLF